MFTGVSRFVDVSLSFATGRFKGVRERREAFVVIRLFLERRREFTKGAVYARVAGMEPYVRPIVPATARGRPPTITTPKVVTFSVITIRLRGKVYFAYRRIR